MLAAAREIQICKTRRQYELLWLQLRDLLILKTQNFSYFTFFVFSLQLFTLLTDEIHKLSVDTTNQRTIGIAFVWQSPPSLFKSRRSDSWPSPVTVPFHQLIWVLIHWIRDAGGCFRHLLLEPPRWCSHQPPLSWRCWVISLSQLLGTVNWSV